MSKILIAFVLLIILNLINIINQLIRRKVILGFGDLTLKSFLSFKIWVTLFSNPYVLLVFFLSGCLFLINLTVFAFVGVNEVTIFSYALLIPAFLFTLLLSYTFLGEKIVSAQYKYIVLLIIAMVVSFLATWGFVKNQV